MKSHKLWQFNAYFDKHLIIRQVGRKMLLGRAAK